MAWVRIHDGAMTHPKLVGLSDKAFRLWIWGLSYSQQHLTDGLLPVEAVPPRIKRAVPDLVRKGLWESHHVGFKVHDYLDWNDSREVVVKKRGDAKERMANARERSSRELLRRVGLEKEALKEGERERKPDARSGRPIFKGQRLTVFEWMLDACAKTLGSFTDAFDLHEWFFALDDLAVATDLVIPQRDNGAWLQSQLLAEARRRGLPIASTDAPAGKLTTRMAQMVANSRRPV